MVYNYGWYRLRYRDDWEEEDEARNNEQQGWQQGRGNPEAGSQGRRSRQDQEDYGYNQGWGPRSGERVSQSSQGRGESSPYGSDYEADYGRRGDYPRRRGSSGSAQGDWQGRGSGRYGGRGDERDYGGRAYGGREDQVNRGSQGFEGQDFGDRSDHGYGQGYRSQSGQQRGRQMSGQHLSAFSGVGPKGWQYSDDRIRKDVNETLARHGDIDPSNVEVTVENGVVTLEGTVSDRRMKRHMEDVVYNCFGVNDVHNHVRVNRDSGSQPGGQGMQTGQSGSGQTSGGQSTGQGTGQAGQSRATSQQGQTGQRGGSSSGSTGGTSGQSRQRTDRSDSEK